MHVEPLFSEPIKLFSWTWKCFLRFYEMQNVISQKPLFITVTAGITWNLTTFWMQDFTLLQSNHWGFKFSLYCETVFLGEGFFTLWSILMPHWCLHLHFAQIHSTISQATSLLNTMNFYPVSNGVTRSHAVWTVLRYTDNQLWARLETRTFEINWWFHVCGDVNQSILLEWMSIMLLFSENCTYYSLYLSADRVYRNSFCLYMCREVLDCGTRKWWRRSVGPWELKK
jgi:hypothetical protein